MTYYGCELVFRFRFACGCKTKHGPILAKFAYQYAGLGGPQQCAGHGAPEVHRDVQKVSEPRGEIELGWWKATSGTRIFLTWEPASRLVRRYDDTEGRLPIEWRRTPLVRIEDEETIWAIVGGDHLGGEWSEPAEEVLARLHSASTSPDPE